MLFLFIAVSFLFHFYSMKLFASQHGGDLNDSGKTKSIGSLVIQIVFSCVWNSTDKCDMPPSVVKIF